MSQGGTSSPSGAASNTPFAPQQQPNAGGGSSPLNTGGGMSGGQQQPMQTAAFGSGQGQMPSFAMPYMQQALGGGFGGGQQQPNAGSQFNAAQNPGANRSNVPDWVQAPEPGAMSSQAFTELTNPATGEKFMAPSGGYSVRQQPDPATVASEYPTQQLDQRAINADPQGFQNYMQQMQQREQQRPGSTMMGPPPPRQNPFQPQQPSFMQDPEYQGYQTQANDLQRQMQEYMQKAPMYQQMQDLQNKMAPFQQRYYQQQQDMQRMQQPLNRQRYDPMGEENYYNRMAQQRQQRQFNPYQQQQQYRQPAGIQGLMGMLGGKNRMQQAQPRMSMDMPQPRPAVMPRSFGREQRYAMPSRDYSRIGSAGAARPADSANFAVVDEAPVMNPAVDYFPNSW